MFGHNNNKKLNINYLLFPCVIQLTIRQYFVFTTYFDDFYESNKITKLIIPYVKIEFLFFLLIIVVASVLLFNSESVIINIHIIYRYNV